MADRLMDLIVGLQRMADGARTRSDDLEFTQREERYDLIKYLDELLRMVDKLRASLLEDRQRMMPVDVARGNAAIGKTLQDQQRALQADQAPKFLQQGPRKDEQDQTSTPRSVR